MTTRKTAGTGNMDNAVTAFLGAIPPERREELRAVVRHARERVSREEREWDGDPDQDDDPDDDPGAPRLAPLPAVSAEEAARAADAILAAAMGGPPRQIPPPGTPVRPQAEPAAQDQFLTRLSSIAPERLRWLSPGRLAAGKITVLDGDPGLGKSTLLCELAARITRGEALPGGEAGPPGAVVLLSAEDDLHDTIRPRVDAAGGDPGRIIAFGAVPDGSPSGRPFVIPGDAWALETVVARFAVTMVIIDPLVAFLDRGLSANNDQDVRHGLASLKTVAERTGAAIVVVRHLNKSAGANPLYRGGGSIGIIGAARCGLLLARDPEDPERRVLAATKGNLTRPPASLAFRLEDVPGSDVARVVWEGASRWSAKELLRAAEEDDQEQPTLLDEARAWLREALKEGARPARELQAEAKAHGIAAPTLKRARRAEGIVARKARGQHGGWTWALPDAPGKEDQGDPLPLLDPLDPLDPLASATDPEPSPEPVAQFTPPDGSLMNVTAPWEREAGRADTG